jgi:hypothetical protein
MIWETFWHDLKIFVLTFAAISVISILIVGFVFQRDIRRGNLNLEGLLKNLFKRLI